MEKNREECLQQQGDDILLGADDELPTGYDPTFLSHDLKNVISIYLAPQPTNLTELCLRPQ